MLSYNDIRIHIVQIQSITFHRIKGRRFEGSEFSRSEFFRFGGYELSRYGVWVGGGGPSFLGLSFLDTPISFQIITVHQAQV